MDQFTMKINPAFIPKTPHPYTFQYMYYIKTVLCDCETGFKCYHSYKLSWIIGIRCLLWHYRRCLGNMSMQVHNSHHQTAQYISSFKQCNSISMQITFSKKIAQTEKIKETYYIYCVYILPSIIVIRTSIFDVLTKIAVHMK